MFGGLPDLDTDRQRGWKRHWDWDAAWTRRFGLVQLRVRDQYRVTVEPPAAVEPVRRAYGVLFRTDGKAVLAGLASGATPDLGIIEADVAPGQEPEMALEDAALSRAGAELARHWLMANLLYSPIDEGVAPFYESIYIAEVGELKDVVPDQRYTRRSVLVRDLLAAVRRRHYEIAEPLLLAIERYVQWRATDTKHEAEVTGA